MQIKPLIGLTPSFYEHKEMDRSILGKSYTDMVQRAGGLPVLIPPINSRDDLAQLLDRLDGIIFTGGDDLDPRYYGEDSEPLTPRIFHPRRGQHDRQIFEYIWEYRLPTLAICLGLQEVNVFLGGSLFQDIPSQIKTAGIHKVGNWFEARHQVTLVNASLLARLCGTETVETNSAHHQAVKAVASELKVVGTSPDGVVEALEPLDDARPLLAVQWHPESETNDQVGFQLFRWLIESAASRAEPQF